MKNSTSLSKLIPDNETTYDYASTTYDYVSRVQRSDNQCGKNYFIL